MRIREMRIWTLDSDRIRFGGGLHSPNALVTVKIRHT